MLPSRGLSQVKIWSIVDILVLATILCAHKKKIMVSRSFWYGWSERVFCDTKPYLGHMEVLKYRARVGLGK